MAKSQLHFVWRYQPLASSPDGMMLEYLRNIPNASTQELILQAARAFWLPLALQAQARGVKSQTELQRIGRVAIYDLLHQIEHLCAALDLERPCPLQSGQLLNVVAQKPTSGLPIPATVQCATQLLQQTGDAGATWNTSIEDL